MSVIYSDRHSRYIDTDFECEEDYDDESDTTLLDNFMGMNVMCDIDKLTIQ